VNRPESHAVSAVRLHSAIGFVEIPEQGTETDQRLVRNYGQADEVGPWQEDTETRRPGG
jgi:hypothetical protein